MTNKSAQTGERSTILSKEEIKKIVDVGRKKPIDKQICIHFLNGKCNRIGKCNDGRKHVKDYKVFMTSLEEDQAEAYQASSEIDALFH